MGKGDGRREHGNLHYLFRADRAAHPMPPDRANALRQYWLALLAKKFSKS